MSIVVVLVHFIMCDSSMHEKEEDIRVDVIVTVSTLEWKVTCDKASPCLLSQAAVTQQ